MTVEPFFTELIFSDNLAAILYFSRPVRVRGDVNTIPTGVFSADEVAATCAALFSDAYPEAHSMLAVCRSESGYLHVTRWKRGREGDFRIAHKTTVAWDRELPEDFCSMSQAEKNLLVAGFICAFAERMPAERN